MKPMSVLLLYAQSPVNKTFSYQYGWPRKFLNHPRFRCTPLNVLDRGWQAFYDRYRSLWHGRFEAIIILHSVFSNGSYLRPRHPLYHAIKASRLPKAYFIGNEYKLMPEKMAFCDALGISLLVTQSNSPDVHRLYRERLGCAVVGIPSGGLDTDVFYPHIDYKDRPIDIGYRSDESPLYLGHAERREIADYVVAHGPAYGLKLDVSLQLQDRLDERRWALFLNQCKAQLGTEAGGDYFELTDTTRKAYIRYTKRFPHPTLADVTERFFKSYSNPIPLRVITGRIVEAAGTKTVQILFEGKYNDYLKPDRHYIPLKKDFSNFPEVVEKLRDQTYCRTLTDNAYEVAVKELTYEHLIDKFYEAFVPLL
jgi:hypothetical protein